MPIVKLYRLLKAIYINGGLRNSLFKMYRFDDLKIGECVGEDKHGNRYFQNKFYFFGRSRWVEYADRYGLDYDGSQVTPDWFGWLHYKTDILPTKQCRRKYRWSLDHTQNLTGTEDQYVPYGTTRPKTSAWEPKKSAVSSK